MCSLHRARGSVLVIFLLLHSATSFYLPGLAPVSFCEPGQTGKENEVPDCKVVRSKKKKVKNAPTVSCYLPSNYQLESKAKLPVNLPASC